MSQVGLRRSWTAFKSVCTSRFAAGIHEAVLRNLAAKDGLDRHMFPAEWQQCVATVHLPVVAESLKCAFITYKLQQSYITSPRAPQPAAAAPQHIQ